MKNTDSLLIFLLFFIPFFTLRAQEVQKQEKSEHRYLGLGIRTGLQLSDLIANHVPPNRLVLNIDPSKYFRIEGQYGSYSKKSEVNVQYYDPITGATLSALLKPKEKSSFIGGGLMGMYPKGECRFIGGIRYGINNYSYESVNYSYYSTAPTLVKETGKETVISGVIGGEYSLAKYFSVGAEFSILSIKDVNTPPSIYSSKKTTNKTMMTEGSLVFRFYLL